MTYSFAPHVDSIVHQACASQTGAMSSPSSSSTRLFVLIDTAQLNTLPKQFQQRLPDAISLLLFDQCFAESALTLSPVLFLLSDDLKILTIQMLALDYVSRQLPVMAVLGSALKLNELARHLRLLLLIEAENVPYLLRFADSQMVLAAITILTPAQRARFFEGIDAWWVVDHQGRLHNLVGDHTHVHAQDEAQSPPVTSLPLQLDVSQTHALLAAAVVHTLASQLRALEPTFAQVLSHAQQTRFASQCIADTQRTGITDEADFTAAALQRWQTKAGHKGQFEAIDDEHR